MSESKKYYKVVCLAISGNGKRIHRNGDVVCESDLIASAIPDLLKGGSIKEASATESKEAGAGIEKVLNANKKQMNDAEEKAQGDLLKAKQEYADLAGIEVEEINGTWGLPKLQKEIAALKED